MPYADLGAVKLYYEISGSADGEPLVLVHGLGAQMIAWYPGLVRQLEIAGFRVIRFDNRDIGLSSKMDAAPDYSVHDMAADIVGLMKTLGLTSAHIAGQSMGGMIVQQLAIDAPAVIRSLTIIYSTPDGSHMARDEEVWATRNEPPAKDRDAAIAQYIKREKLSGLDGFDEDWVQAFATSVIDRNYSPEGAARQEQAIRRSPSRLEGLSRLDMPVAVIHGRQDRLLSYTGGIAIAQAIRDSELHVFTNMGHQLPPHLWPDFVRIIRRNAERAGAFAGVTAMAGE